MKEQGELSELRFLLKAQELGFTVSKPWGDNAKYDFILDHGGKLTRVQVKSTSKLSKKRNRYVINAGSGSSSKIPYSPADIDVMAAYIVPENCWYLIPVQVMDGKIAVHLYPHKVNGSKYEVYRECWGSLTNPRVKSE